MIDAAQVEAAARAAGLIRFEIVVRRLAESGAADAAVRAPDAGELYPASMIKTPLAVAVAAAVEDGRLRWSDRISVLPSNLTVNDAPSPLAAGYAATLGELTTLMLARSDNVATNVLIDAVGRRRATADLAALGFPQTAIRRKLSGALPLIADPEADGRNRHPPHEAADLFERLARATVPGSATIGAALAEQYWNAKLSAGLAPGDRFAHKTGDTDEVSHDGGILTATSGARWVIVAYTGMPSNDATDACFAAFMRTLRTRL